MKRTNQQNKALHLMFSHLADELNDAGLDMKKTLRAEIDIPWSPLTVKEYLWRPIMKAQLGKVSTTDLETGEVNLVFKTLCRHLGIRLDINIEMPSIESLMNKLRDKNNA